MIFQSLLAGMAHISSTESFVSAYHIDYPPFLRTFQVNSFIKDRVSAHRLLFLNEHGFMMSLLDTCASLALASRPLKLTDAFLDAYLGLISYREDDVVVLVDVPMAVARDRERGRGKYVGRSETEQDIIYSSIAEAIPPIMQRLKLHATVKVLQNDQLDDAVAEMESFIAQRRGGAS